MNRLIGAGVPEFVLKIEHWLRTHPGGVGVFSVFSVAVIGLVEPQTRGDLSRALTLSIPLGLCSYAVGPIAGLVMAASVTVLWALDAMSGGLAGPQAGVLFLARLLSNLGVVVMSAIAAAAARAREHYIEAQEELARMRADLVSAFSHDLRSPLSAISSYAGIVQDGSGEAGGIANAEAAERILINAARLNNLISDMLTASRPDSAVSVVAGDAAPVAVLQDLQTEFDHVGRDYRTAIEWQAASDLPPIRTDVPKLTSIVRNLVTNAVKFTPQGRVAVRITYDAAARTHRIEVEDNGPGIPAESLPQLFDPFYRVESTRRITGSGLGLFIVKRFVELLHGQIAVDSTVGRGTRFTVTLPSLP